MLPCRGRVIAKEFFICFRVFNVVKYLLVHMSIILEFFRLFLD